jgi:hypothetical protein
MRAVREPRRERRKQVAKKKKGKARGSMGIGQQEARQ